MTGLVVHTSGAADAPPLVLLHGVTDSGPSWADAVERWSPTWRVLAVDQLGHGLSPRFTDAQLALPDPVEAMHDALVTAVEEHIEQPVVVVGHSMGGGMAAVLGARRPDLVRAVVLEDPAWFDGPVSRRWPDPGTATAERVADSAAAAADLEAYVAAGRRDHPTWPEAELQPWAEASARWDRRFGETGRTALQVPWRDVARALTRPTLVVTGTDDVILDDGACAEIAALGNPALEVVVVDGVGHCVRRDDREAFHAVVDPWITAHAS